MRRRGGPDLPELDRHDVVARRRVGAEDGLVAARGPHTLLWPDNDPAGLKYAKAVADALLPLGCHVRTVDVAKLAEQFATEDSARAGTARTAW